MVDLKEFCADDDCRTYLAEPFSNGDYSYATDGIVLVQVPRRPDIPDGGPSLEKLLHDLQKAWARGLFRAMPDFQTIPGKPRPKCTACGGLGRHIQCDECEGTGYIDCSECGNEKSCSSCDGEGGYPADTPDKANADCESCDGTGVNQFSPARPDIARFETHDFNLKYIQRIATLPNLTVAFGSSAKDSQDPDSALAFYFEGGRGILMAMRRSYLNMEAA